MRETICTVLGVVGGALAAAFGGWNAALTTLVFFLSLDYLTGLLVAGIFRRSPKTKTGGLQSERAGQKSHGAAAGTRSSSYGRCPAHGLSAEYRLHWLYLQ